MYVVRNMANDAFDQKFQNRNKTNCQNVTIEQLVWHLQNNKKLFYALKCRTTVDESKLRR